MSGATITAVADSTGACLERIRPAAFTNITAGRLGVAARPGMRRVSWLASDILTALGCDENVTGAGMPGEADPDNAAAWLRAHQIEDLYVQFAWDISHPALAAACEIGLRADLRLWLVGDSPYSDAHIETLARFSPREWTQTEFLDHWANLTEPGEAASIADAPQAPVATRSNAPCADAWPRRVPDDDFTTFRAACRDRLVPEAFAAVDAYLHAEHADASAQLLSTLADQEESATGREEAIATWLANRWQVTSSLQHFIVTIRAAQIAAFSAGYFMQVDLDQVIGVGGTLPRRAQRSAATWDLLRAYPEPHRSTTCALAAAGIGINPMATLPISSYEASAGVLTDPRTAERFTVEEPARIFVEAQQALRRLQGATEDDLLIVDTTRGKPVAPRNLATIVRQARRELGAAVALAPPDRLTPDPRYWYRRWGISVQELP